MAIHYKSNLDKVLKELDNANETALTAIGEFGRSEAISRSPVGVYPAGSGRVGGNLRDSNDYKVEADKDRVLLGNSADYSIWVHEGSSRQRSQPWLRNSVMENVSRINSLIKQAYRLGR